mgnify:CR=1 FL=1
MIIDGAFILHLTKELNSRLEKSRLEKIYQIHDMRFAFQFYHQGQKDKLIIDLSPNNFGAFITEKDMAQTMSTQFLVSLKKQLESGILNTISQHLTDRVIIFDFTVYDFIEGPVSKKLIFEAMGKHSNLLLIQNDVIIDTYKKMFFESGRQLIPGAQFEFFPSDKKSFDMIDYQIMENPKMMTNHYMGISMKLASYLFNHQLQVKDLTFNPTKDITKQTGYFTDIFLNTHTKKHYQTLSELQDDDVYVNLQYKQSYELFIDKYLKKLHHKKEQLLLSLEESKKNLSERYKGDFIYQSGVDLNQKMSSITVYDTKIDLDVTKTLNENAQAFYKAYQKAKRGITHINNQIDETHAQIDVFTDFKTYIDISSEADIQDLEDDLIPYGYKSKKQKQKKKKTKTPNIIKIIDKNATYFIGKNDIQNAYVTHELAQANDYFFHVKDAPGAHLVVRTESLDEPVLRKAAMLAAYFSSQKYSSSIPVDYTLIRYVKKIPKVPGFKVQIKNQKTMYIDIDEDLIKNYL